MDILTVLYCSYDMSLKSGVTSEPATKCSTTLSQKQLRSSLSSLSLSLSLIGMPKRKRDQDQERGGGHLLTATCGLCHHTQHEDGDYMYECRTCCEEYKELKSKIFMFVNKTKMNRRKSKRGIFTNHIKGGEGKVPRKNGTKVAGRKAFEKIIMKDQKEKEANTQKFNREQLQHLTPKTNKNKQKTTPSEGDEQRMDDGWETVN